MACGDDADSKVNTNFRKTAGLSVSRLLTALHFLGRCGGTYIRKETRVNSLINCCRDSIL